MLDKYFFSIVCLFTILLIVDGQNLNSGSSNKKINRKSKFEIDFDLPNEVPVAHGIKMTKVSSDGKVYTNKNSNSQRTTFDPDQVLKELSDYEDSVQFKKNGGKFLTPRDRSSFKTFEVSGSNPGLRKSYGR